MVSSLLIGDVRKEYKLSFSNWVTEDEGKVQKDKEHHSEHIEAKHMAKKSQMGECDMNGHYVQYGIISHLLLFSR